MSASTLYKVLDANGQSCNGGKFAWRLPTGGRPGEWTPRIKNPEPCERGYHLTDAANLIAWLPNDDCTVWVAEGRGAVRLHTDKVVFESARLVRQVLTINPRTLRLYAALCAEHVLSVFEGQVPGDPRPREAIAVSRRFADGLATKAERDAAWAAAGDAAWAAERQWQTDRLIELLEAA